MSDTTTHETVKLKLEVEVDVQVLRDLLCTAVEGGSNYWADFGACRRTKDLDYLSVRVEEQTPSREAVARVSRIVTAEDLALGLSRLSASSFPAALGHLADALSENYDATTADVLLQMTVFGEVIYG